MAKKNCVITVIDGEKRRAAKEADGLSRETKEAADDFFKRNGEVLKNASLTTPSKK